MNPNDDMDYFKSLGFVPLEEEQQEPDDIKEFLDLGFVPLDEEEEEPSFLKKAAKETGRFAARGAARIGETVAGLPGDIYQFTKWLTERKGKEVPEGYVGKIFGALPTSQQVREKVTQPLTGEYLEPQAPWEGLSDEVISDFASLAIPVKGKIPFARAIGTSLAANLSKETVKGLGIGEKGQLATKLGTMFLSGLIGRGTAKQYANDLFAETAEMIPEESVISAEKASKNLNKFQKDIKTGGLSPQKQPAYGLSVQFEKMIKQNNGNIPVKELPAFRTTINDFRFDRNLTPRAHYYLNKFDDLVSNSLKKYGEENPLFLKKYNEANQAVAGIKGSEKIAKNISKYIDPNKFDAKDIYYISQIFNLTTGGLLAKGAGALAGATGVKILKRFATNPALRKFYLNTINQAAKGNSAATVKNISRLVEEMRNEEFYKEDLGFEEEY